MPVAAFAQAETSKIDPADTAWMMAASALVLLMTIPGLALFYCGMVRKKNVLATMAQSVMCTGLCSILWFAFGYSLSFAGDASFIGSFARAFLRGTGLESTSSFAPTIPEVLFMFYPVSYTHLTLPTICSV